MSTRSLIGIRNNEGLTYVYCHFDGYLDGVGITLVEDYDTEDKVKSLLEKGDMSSLGNSLDTCDFYNEDDSDASTIPDCEDIKDRYYKCGQNCWADYVYLFEDGKWYYSRETGRFINNEFVYNHAEWKLVVEGLNEKD